MRSNGNRTWQPRQPRCTTEPALQPAADPRGDLAITNPGIHPGKLRPAQARRKQINVLLIEALRTFDRYYGETFTVECPTGSGLQMTLAQVADELSRRLSSVFLEDASGRRPVFGSVEQFQRDPGWHDLIPFHEYFNGDTGAGVGASHQTGWTALVARLLLQSEENHESHRSDSGTSGQRAPRRAEEAVSV